MCFQDSTGTYEGCGTEDICVSGKLIDRDKWYVDYSDSKSFHNWMTDFEMYCDSSFMIGLFGSAFFVGFTLSGVILKQADKIGRKKIIVFGVFLQLFCSYGLYFIHNKYILYIVLFISGLSISKDYVSYIFITEIVPDRWRLLFGSIFMTSGCFIPIMASCLYYMLGGKDWKVIMLIPLIMTPISVIISLFIPESPRYLHSIGKIKEFKENIKLICKINKVDEPIDSILLSNKHESNNQAEEGIKESKNFSIVDELKSKHNLINLIVIVLCFTFVSFDYYMIGFYMKYLGGNIYLNVIMSTISDNMGNFGAYIAQKILGTK